MAVKDGQVTPRRVKVSRSSTGKEAPAVSLSMVENVVLSTMEAAGVPGLAARVDELQQNLQVVAVILRDLEASALLAQSNDSTKNRMDEFVGNVLLACENIRRLTDSVRPADEDDDEVPTREPDTPDEYVEVDDSIEEAIDSEASPRRRRRAQ